MTRAPIFLCSGSDSAVADDQLYFIDLLNCLNVLSESRTSTRGEISTKCIAIAMHLIDIQLQIMHVWCILCESHCHSPLVSDSVVTSTTCKTCACVTNDHASYIIECSRRNSSSCSSSYLQLPSFTVPSSILPV